MRDAPSVSYPVGRSAFFGLVLLALGILGLAVLLAWAVTPVAEGRAGPALLVGVTGWAGWLAWAWASWRASPRGRIEWRAGATGTGGAWYWCPDDRRPLRLRAPPEPVWDVYWAVLVRLEGRWAWLEAGDDGARWWALRRALLAAASP